VGILLMFFAVLPWLIRHPAPDHQSIGAVLPISR
jgi:hypothetical protein